MKVTRQERDQIVQLFAHIQRAKDELARMNVGTAHDEIAAALSITINIEEYGEERFYLLQR